MADEKETQAAPAAPQFDMNAMADRLAQAAAVGTQQAIERVAQRNQQQQQAVERERAVQADPVASTILQTVAPHLRDIAVKGDHGRDAAVFYATTPGAHKHSGLIESRINQLASQGIHVDRASVFNLIKGEMGLTHEGVTFEEAIKRRDEDVRRAEEAATVRGSRGGAPTTRLVDPYSLTTEDLGKALEDVNF
jgi:hypothetical protein